MNNGIRRTQYMPSLAPLPRTY